MELNRAMSSAASGLKVQGTRLRVAAENIANAESIATEAGGKPYRRQLVQFGTIVDRKEGSQLVEVKRIVQDGSDFKPVFDPSHPSADENGYVLYPNVNRFIEMMDMKEAQRSYSANLESIAVSRDLLRETIGIIGN